MYDLQISKLEKIKKYIQKDQLQNTNAIDRYVDSILEKKVKRKTKTRIIKL